MASVRRLGLKPNALSNLIIGSNSIVLKITSIVVMFANWTYAPVQDETLPLCQGVPAPPLNTAIIITNNKLVF